MFSDIDIPDPVNISVRLHPEQRDILTLILEDEQFQTVVDRSTFYNAIRTLHCPGFEKVCFSNESLDFLLSRDQEKVPFSLIQSFLIQG